MNFTGSQVITLVGIIAIIFFSGGWVANDMTSRLLGKKPIPPTPDPPIEPIKEEKTTPTEVRVTISWATHPEDDEFLGEEFGVQHHSQ